MKTKKQLTEEWQKYINDNRQWYRSFNTKHHYFRCRYASKFWLEKIDEIYKEIHNQ